MRKNAAPKWVEAYQVAKSAYEGEQAKMLWRKQRLDGTHAIKGPDGNLAKEQAKHVRNICLEMVETQVDSAIPQPKVTAVREADEPLAREIEDMLRNLIDRLPMERMNDEGERISPTQGGYYFLVGWMAEAMGKGWMGDLDVDLLHPRQVIPQPGIYQVADMDYVFVNEGITKEQVRQHFGVDMEGAGEEDPDARSLGEGTEQSNELLTMHTCYYRNKRGGIGRYRWIEDTEIEALEDYQARRVKRCRKCGEIGNGKKCGYCGSTAFAEEVQTEEVLDEDLTLRDGTVIPAESPARDEYGQIIYEPVEAAEMVTGVMEAGLMPQMLPGGEPTLYTTVASRPKMEPTRLPYYSPDVYPLILRKNVSRSGQLLGGSDVDALEDAQNDLNKLSTKIGDKVLGGGSFTTVPRKLGSFISDRDNKVLQVENAADLECIRTYNTQVDISPDLRLRADLYEEGRQTIGVTDSMQGRQDTTATSRVAKEFSARQAEGRLESKRVMKRAAFADLYEVLFRFMLAYADEPRSLRSFDKDGKETYTIFDRHDFLYQDDDGTWKYNTDFLFSCDTAAPLASNRQALWQEARMNYESGALGNPQDPETLLRFWRLMEQYSYPLAAQVLQSLEEQKEKAEQAMQLQQQMQQTAAVMGGAGYEMPQM